MKHLTQTVSFASALLYVQCIAKKHQVSTLLNGLIPTEMGLLTDLTYLSLGRWWFVVIAIGNMYHQHLTHFCRFCLHVTGYNTTGPLISEIGFLTKLELLLLGRFCIIFEPSTDTYLCFVWILCHRLHVECTTRRIWCFVWKRVHWHESLFLFHYRCDTIRLLDECRRVTPRNDSFGTSASNSLNRHVAWYVSRSLLQDDIVVYGSL